MLSRELESRFEVWSEQYTIGANIEAETAAMMARTMLLPAALRRHIALVEAAGMDSLAAEARTLTGEFAEAISALEEANSYPDGVEGLELAVYARDNQLTALARARAGRPAGEDRRRRPLAAGTARSCSSSRAGHTARAAGRCSSAPRRVCRPPARSSGGRSRPSGTIAVEREHDGVRAGRDRGGARDVAQEGDLAEHVAVRERAEVAARAGHVETPSAIR